MKLFFAYTKDARGGWGRGCEKLGNFWLKPYMTRVEVTIHKDKKKAKIFQEACVPAG